MLKKFSDKRFIIWFLLMLLTFFGLTLMLIVTYTNSGFKTGIKHRAVWAENIITPLYFTFMSNLSAFIVSTLVVFGIIKFESKHTQRLKVFMTVNLTVTCLIFWSALAFEIKNYSPLGVVTTTIVHAITPILAITVLIYEARTTSINKEQMASPVHSAVLLTVFPLLWLAMGIIVYYAMGADKDSAIYGFLDFKKSIWISIGIIGGISMLYPSLAYGYQWLYNR